MNNDLRQQTPSVPENWLHDEKSDWTRYFTKLVYLGKDAEPWPECTNEQLIEWKEQHPEPENE